MNGDNQRSITRVGYFHFGTGYYDPIGTLGACLDDAKQRHESLADSLVVLPEGFNLQQDYWDKYSGKGDGSTDIRVIDQLKDVSHRYGCAFVAGLIVADCLDVSPPYNSAYLIDGGFHRLLSRKHADDISANYTPHPQHYERPLVWRGVGIVALMCKDSGEFQERFDELAAQLNGPSARVVCIPMNMTNGLNGGNPGLPLTARYGLSDAVWIAANSHTGWVHSFATNRQGVVQEPVCRGAIAKIEIFWLTD
jgi:predicted amidohydrolase